MVTLWSAKPPCAGSIPARTSIYTIGALSGLSPYGRSPEGGQNRDSWVQIPSAPPKICSANFALSLLKGNKRPGGGTGIRYRLKICRPQGIEGSIPSLGTIQIKYCKLKPRPEQCRRAGFLCYLVNWAKAGVTVMVLAVNWLFCMARALSSSASLVKDINSAYFVLAP